MKLHKLALFLPLALGLAPFAGAAITYVDADGVNSVTEPGGVSSTDPSVSTDNAGSTSDNKWNIRPFGNGLNGNSAGYTPTIYETIGSEDVPMLVTTMSGLTAGATYNVFVYFQAGDDTNLSQNWDVLAGFTTGSMINYTRTHAASTDADAGDFTTSVQAIDPNRLMVQSSMGTAVADGSGEIKVYIDSNGGTSSTRTWYDGVGHELVPEPGSTLLLGLAGLTLILRRRK